LQSGVRRRKATRGPKMSSAWSAFHPTPVWELAAVVSVWTRIRSSYRILCRCRAPCWCGCVFPLPCPVHLPGIRMMKVDGRSTREANFCRSCPQRATILAAPSDTWVIQSQHRQECPMVYEFSKSVTEAEAGSCLRQFFKSLFSGTCILLRGILYARIWATARDFSMFPWCSRVLTKHTHTYTYTYTRASLAGFHWSLRRPGVCVCLCLCLCVCLCGLIGSPIMLIDAHPEDWSWTHCTSQTDRYMHVKTRTSHLSYSYPLWPPLTFVSPASRSFDSLFFLISVRCSPHVFGTSRDPLHPRLSGIFKLKDYAWFNVFGTSRYPLHPQLSGIFIFSYDAWFRIHTYL